MFINYTNRATKIVIELRDIEYDERLKVLDLKTLDLKRKSWDMI